nr:lysylphosphatidylglycerol synthase transmembrane domain-containing protein [Maliibacterium massiliense]
MNQGKTKSGKKKIWGSVIYIALISLLVVYFFTQERNLEDFITAVQNMTPSWLIAALCAMALYYFFDAASMQFVLRCMWKEKASTRLGICARVCLIGQFYNAVTPSSTGGQPMQVYNLHKEGVPVGIASSAMVVRFVSYQIAMLILSLTGLLMFYSFIAKNFGAFIAMACFGLLLNVGSIIFLVMAMFNYNFTIKISDKLTAWLGRIHILRRPEEARDKMHGILADFHKSRKHILVRPVRVLLSILYMLLHISMYFSVVYFIYRAFSLSGASFLQMLVIQAFFHIAVSFFPMPGAAGASEGGFLLFYRVIFTPNIVFTAMLVWRFLTYYVKIIAGALTIAWDTIVGNRRRRRLRRSGQIEP